VSAPPPTRQYEGVPLSRVSWLVTVAVCLLAALLLLLNGYIGYSGVLVAVGAAAAVNLL
jgi:ABC-type Fe3+-siderophore transport system permease subunit